VQRRELSFAEQNRLVTALCEAESVSGGIAKARLMETHISYVVLAGEFVYKIKKTVDFGFLNFTTLRARRFYCDEEVRLNRRFAPYLYLGVVPITGSLDSPRIGGGGETLDFAVKMREFPQESLADNLVSQATVSSAEIDELSATLARFHLAAKPAKYDTKFGEPEAILARALENFRELLQLPVKIDTALVAVLEHWTKNEFARRGAAFEYRKYAGYVRECHGDLHLGNIVYLDGRLTPFDCIEFNDDLRWIDVISDIAFLTMDLDYHRRRDFSARLLNQYLEATGDYGGVSLLRYYQVYRAIVRAKVAVLKAGSDSHTSTEISEGDKDYSNHIRLADTYTRLRQPALIITHGLSGSGKTTLTQSLLEQVGAIRLRSDVERKRMHGLDSSGRSDSGLGAGLYAPDVTAATYHHLLGLARPLLAAGYPVVVDATFLKHRDRWLFRQLAQELAVPFAIADIYAPVDELRRRVNQRADQGRDASEATSAVLERQLESQEPFTADERPHVFWLDSTSLMGPAAGAGAWKPLIEKLTLSNSLSQ
jgi:aminoglycoside phosphotransferase family enzyme/predicted kinase